MRLNIKASEIAQDALMAFCETEGFDALSIAMELMVKEGLEADVLKYNLSSGSEGLVIAKARVEGARKSLNYLLELRDRLKQQQ